MPVPAKHTPTADYLREEVLRLLQENASLRVQIEIERTLNRKAPELLELVKDFVQASEVRGRFPSLTAEARALLERIEGAPFVHRFVQREIES